MPLIHASLARRADGEVSGQPERGSEGAVVLAEHSTVQGNFQAVGNACAQHLDYTSEDVTTFGIDEYHVSYLCRGSLIYGVISSKDVKRTVNRAVLHQFEKDFKGSQHYDPDNLRRAPSGTLQASVGPKIKQILEYVNSNPAEYDKIQKVQQNVDEVRQIVIDNIDKVLERGERMEALEAKTTTLELQAADFEKTGRQLKSKLWWENKKMLCAAVGISLVVVLVLIFIVVGALGGFRQ